MAERQITSSLYATITVKWQRKKNIRGIEWRAKKKSTDTKCQRVRSKLKWVCWNVAANRLELHSGTASVTERVQNEQIWWNKVNRLRSLNLNNVPEKNAACKDRKKKKYWGKKPQSMQPHKYLDKHKDREQICSFLSSVKAHILLRKYRNI